MPLPPSSLPVLLALLAACAVPEAQAQVRHCVAVDGTQVYTDRRCEDFGAAAMPVQAPGGYVPGASLYRSQCPRTVQDLAWAVDAAVRSGDVNQLAGLYDWTGLSTAEGYRLMGRLAAVARRPLVDVQPAYAGGDPEPRFDEDTGALLPMRQPRLVGLRVEQTLANGSTPSRTQFGLRRNQGCWWIRF
jgi:hypothetical protein